ncbi:MAG: RDD family protein [Calditrichaeota bacterium]|nr:MAG: RDD family protein [Calditrichota bacterium]
MEYVGFGKRLAAYLIDAIILAIPMFILQTLIMGDAMSGMQAGDPAAMQEFTSAYFKVAALNILIGIVYVVGMWTYADGATLGKKALRIKVVKSDGSPITLGSAFLRYIGYFISSLVCLLGYLWIIWDQERRGWHDMIANTRVVPAE